jgi:DNA-binding NarL/FixJ family response regulator
VLFMTALTDSEHVVQGFEAGAIDYVTKPIQCTEVLARVASHLRTARILQSARTASQPVRFDDKTCYKTLSQRFQLTDREIEVLRWVSCGKTNKDIGGVLQLSPRTVNKHLEHIYINSASKPAPPPLPLGRLRRSASLLISAVVA